MYLDDCVCVLPDLTWLPLLGVGRKSWYIIIIIIITIIIIIIIHTLLNSLTSSQNLSSEAATSTASSVRAIYDYMKQSWRQKTVSQFNINRKLLTYIPSSYPDTPLLPTPHTLSIFNIQSIISYSFSRSIDSQNISFAFASYFSHTNLTANTRATHPLPCLRPHCSSHIPHTVRAQFFIISTLPNNLPTTRNKLIPLELPHSYLSPSLLYIGTIYIHPASQ